MASEAYNIQKLANQSAKEIQQMVNSANKVTLDFNKTEAATARKFEKEMSNTSHQREVADLKKAGLNPVLSANSGAMSYTGASASAQAESGASSMSGLYGSLMNSITGLKQSQMSADAQLRTAQLSAAATRYAAQQSAQAQKYAADMNYKTQMDKPQSSPWSLADKYGNKLYKNFGGWFKDKISASKTLHSTSQQVAKFDRDNLKNLKRGVFSLSNKRGNIDDCNALLSRYGINFNKLSDKDRSYAARAIYDLQYSKTADLGIAALSNLRKKYPKK